MTQLENEELCGTTLLVYSFMVKEGKPVGPREIMRSAGLNSPSTAHRQLQKLEALGLIQKDLYGEYIVKEKTSINGYFWIGRNLVPRLMCYSFFFCGLIATALIVITTQYFFQSKPLNVDLIYLVASNTVAMVLFLSEGLLLLIKNKRKETKKANKPSDYLNEEKTVA